jgi:hypothetical protein
MGTEYNLYNHHKASFFELGKGPWYMLNSVVPVLYDSKKFLETLKKEWDNFSAESEEAKIKYFTLLAQALQEFVKDSPEETIQCYGDSGDAVLWADFLKYEFVGSRYFLDRPEDYKKYVDHLKKKIAEDQEEAELAFSYSEGELEMMRIEGWNFKNKNGGSNG